MPSLDGAKLRLVNPSTVHTLFSNGPASRSISLVKRLDQRPNRTESIAALFHPDRRVVDDSHGQVELVIPAGLQDAYNCRQTEARQTAHLGTFIIVNRPSGLSTSPKPICH